MTFINIFQSIQKSGKNLLKNKLKTRWNAIGFIDLSPLACEIELNISTAKHMSHWFVHVSSDGTIYTLAACRLIAFDMICFYLISNATYISFLNLVLIMIFIFICILTLTRRIISLINLVTPFVETSGFALKLNF